MNDDLTVRAKNVDRSVAALLRYGSNNRKWIRLLVTVTAMMIVVMVVLGLQIRSERHTAQTLRVYQHTSCEAGNTSRALQTRLWEYALAVSAAGPTTAAERTELATFHHLVLVTFAPRTCP